MSDRFKTRVNLLVQLLASLIFCSALWLASHTSNLLVVAGCAFVFSYIANTIFALMHESVHRVYSRTKWINEAAGILCASFFPTGLTFQRICHLGHHLRNRTDHEMFDMYYPDDNKFLKFSQFYAILTGVYWLTIPIGWMLYLVFPWSYHLLNTKNRAIAHTGAIMMMPFLNHPKKIRIRVELIFTILVQASLFYFLHLKFLPTLFCFWTFGMFWGSLQYADHAWSERDIRNGAWDLKVNPITQWIFLNYHLHRAHHGNPGLSWFELPANVDAKNPRPSFLSVYVEMWKGPRPATAAAPKPIGDALLAVSTDDDLDIEMKKSPEWLCFKQFYHFSKRHFRYFKIAVSLYLYSFVGFDQARRMRLGFCALQLMDDYLDGDRASVEDPLELATQLKIAISKREYDSSDLQQLMKAFEVSMLDTKDHHECMREVVDVISAMQFDRERMTKHLILNAQELRAHHHRTFTHSLNINLIAMGSSLRTSDMPEILDLFALSSTIRDLKEDLEKGLINIPAEVIAQIPDFHSLSPAQIVSKIPLKHWIAEEQTRSQAVLAKCQERSIEMKRDAGKKLFSMYVQSMKKYSTV